jgi:hypothetical protein
MVFNATFNNVYVQYRSSVILLLPFFICFMKRYLLYIMCNKSLNLLKFNVWLWSFIAFRESGHISYVGYWSYLSWYSTFTAIIVYTIEFVCASVRFMVFNVTFSNIAVISWCSVLLMEKTTDLSQVTDNLYHIMLYTLPWSRFELTNKWW